MLRKVLIGAVAGAAGTVALNVATYADMALRGRPSSSAPATLAGILAKKVGLPLSFAGSDKKKVQNRESGLGALMGYANGLGMGIGYGLLGSLFRNVPWQVTGIGLGIAVMAASDVPIATTGISDPKTWKPADWAADIIPHLIYGFVTVAVYRALMKRPSVLKQMGLA